MHNDTINAQEWIGDNQEEELIASEEKEEKMQSDKVTPLTFKAGEKQHDKRGQYGRITEIGYPAYMVNRKWEVEWANESAEKLFFAHNIKELSTAEERNVFRLLIKALPKTALTLPKAALVNLEDFISLNAEIAALIFLHLPIARHCGLSPRRSFLY